MKKQGLKIKFMRMMPRFAVFALTFLTIITVFCMEASANDTIRYQVPVYNETEEPASGIKEWTTVSTDIYMYATSERTTYSQIYETAFDTFYVAESLDLDVSINVQGKVKLVIPAGVTLKVNNIHVGAGNSLTIYGASAETSRIVINGSSNNAGIGGNRNENNGPITINKCNVTLTKKCHEAAIGGGQYGAGSHITINESTITLDSEGKNQYKGTCGAGIGGGEDRTGSYIAINGGSINVFGGYGGGAAIGGGQGGNGENISLRDCAVSLITLAKGACIGGGENNYGGSDGKYITLDNVSGKIQASYGSTAASGTAIGGGNKGDGEYLTIKNCNNLSLSNSSDAAVIGGGDNKWGHEITIENSNLKISAGANAAAIGGGLQGSGQNINIIDSVLEAHGEDGAGIGGGKYAGGNYITIKNSTVTATASGGGAGIGGGRSGPGENITIIDSTVNASTSQEGFIVINGGGAGIGGGYGKVGKNITIENSIIDAKGNYGGAGIGGGSGASGEYITICKGSIIKKAYGDHDAAGIGGGENGEGRYIYIIGSTVEDARGSTKEGGAGIGGGQKGCGHHIYISENSDVKATGGKDSAGIGGAPNTSGNNIFISNSTVTAIGDNDGAGIGGGYKGSGNDISITDCAVVTATGGYRSAGIGGGYDNKGKNITIYNSTVYAKGGAGGGAGIGGGDEGSCEDLDISYSNVEASANGGGGDAIGKGEGGDSSKRVYISNAEILKINGTEVKNSGGDLSGLLSGKNLVVLTNPFDSIVAYCAPVYDETGYMTEDQLFECSEYTYLDENSTELTTGWYRLCGDVTIDGEVLIHGDVKLLLSNGTYSATNFRVPEDASLTVYAENDKVGGLFASGRDGYAGIGGGPSETNGPIHIHGGVIVANGGRFAAGIGSGQYGDASDIIIDQTGENVLTVTANGGTGTMASGSYSAGGAGIGSGIFGNADNITIGLSDGVVATGGFGGAGVGSGYNGNAENLKILNATLKAYGGTEGAGIGSGRIGYAKDIKIMHSGTIEAYGGAVAAGIGGGRYACGEDIHIDRVHSLLARGGFLCVGIGSGFGALEASTNITIADNMTITLNSTVLTETYDDYSAILSDCGTVTLKAIVTGQAVSPSMRESHVHEWSYSASGASITATCANSDDKHFLNTSETVTLVAPESLAYDGQPKEVLINGALSAVEALDVVYYRDGTKLDGAPSEIGTYTATLTVDTDKTAYLEFRIKSKVTVTTAPTASAITYGQTLANSNLSGGFASVAGSFAWKNQTAVPAVADSNTTEYLVVFTPDDDMYDTVECKVTLTVNKATQIVEMPTANYVTTDKVVLNEVETGQGTTKYGYSDSARTAPALWQDSTEFTGLTDGKQYFFFAMYEGNGNYLEAVSNGAEIETLSSVVNNPVTLTFCNSELPSVIVEKGTTIELSMYNPVAYGVKFKGWYADEEYTEGIEYITMDESKSVYALWTGVSLCKRGSDCPAAQFTDLNLNLWYHDGVDFCVGKGYMQGVSEERFNPYGTLSRAMIVTMLWRMEGNPEADDAMTFEDVPDGRWYTNAICWAQSAGLVEGNNTKRFNPNNNITREQLAVILYRYAIYKGCDVSVGEVTNILNYDDAIGGMSEYAIPALRWACGAGIINGIGTKLEARSFANRIQAACMVQRFCIITER